MFIIKKKFKTFHNKTAAGCCTCQVWFVAPCPVTPIIEIRPGDMIKGNSHPVLFAVYTVWF